MPYATLHHKHGTTEIPKRHHLQAAKLAADYHARHGPSHIELWPTRLIIYRGRHRFKPTYSDPPLPNYEEP